MGCLFHKAKQHTSQFTNKSVQYSWDKRGRVNLQDYIVEDVSNAEVYKMPGTINGQQFVIQNCKHSVIYVFDHVNSVTVDDCVNCKIILSAVKGSVFLRDCKDCVCVVACGQFRARDCRKLSIFLCCASQPIIESSINAHFGCYQLFYEGIEGHFLEAGLSVFNNEWSCVHDFTPIEGENNWCLLPDTIKIQDYISAPTSEELKDLNLSLMAEKSIVPYTWGPHKTPIGQMCLVAFFTDGQHVQRAKAFINRMKLEHPDCLLLLSKEARLTANEAEGVFKTTTYSSVVQHGQVIGLQYCGPYCMDACRKVAMTMSASTGSTSLIYVSASSQISHQQNNSFFNLLSM